MSGRTRVRPRAPGDEKTNHYCVPGKSSRNHSISARSTLGTNGVIQEVTLGLPKYLLGRRTRHVVITDVSSKTSQLGMLCPQTYPASRDNEVCPTSGEFS